MFVCIGDWYKNTREHRDILQAKYKELSAQKSELSHLISSPDTILNREATSAGDDEEFLNQKSKRLREVDAKLQVLRNALSQMGLKCNADGVIESAPHAHCNALLSVSQTPAFNLTHHAHAHHASHTPEPQATHSHSLPLHAAAPPPQQSLSITPNAMYNALTSVFQQSAYNYLLSSIGFSAAGHPQPPSQAVAHSDEPATAASLIDLTSPIQHQPAAPSTQHQAHVAGASMNGMNELMLRPQAPYIHALQHQQAAHSEQEHADENDENHASSQYAGMQQPPRVQSSHFGGMKTQSVTELTQKYESALNSMRDRKLRRARIPMQRRVFHVDADLTAEQRSTKTDSMLQHNMSCTEHVWVESIDDALSAYIDGDVIELAEGKHVVSGSYAIYGSLTICGVATSNWKTLIENKEDSTHFIWCIGKDTRVRMENVLVRSCGSHLGIVRVSLRAQFIGINVVFHCNGLEGFNLEHESKLWLDRCVILNSVGAAIHVNTGCKCLLTQTNIVNCGESDYQIVHGQGAIVIYGTDINYAEHLIRKTPSLRFPSMENVPTMVLDPDSTLAAMLRGRTYLYVQECKIKSNYGFGISFEVTPAFHPLPVPAIASMMDVSITVRETHFTENTFGNMGKIPAHWVLHRKQNEEHLIDRIKRINPDIFPQTEHKTETDEYPETAMVAVPEHADQAMVDRTDGTAVNHSNNNNSNSNSNTNEHHDTQQINDQVPLIPLTEQALRAQVQADEARIAASGSSSSVQIIEKISSLNALDQHHSNNASQNDVDSASGSSSRSKSEPPILSGVLAKTALISNHNNKQHELNSSRLETEQKMTDASNHSDRKEQHDHGSHSQQTGDGRTNQNHLHDQHLPVIKSADKREREVSLGSNASPEIAKMREHRKTLRLSAPPPPTTLLSSSSSASREAYMNHNTALKSSHLNKNKNALSANSAVHDNGREGNKRHDLVDDSTTTHQKKACNHSKEEMDEDDDDVMAAVCAVNTELANSKNTHNDSNNGTNNTVRERPQQPETQGTNYRKQPLRRSLRIKQKKQMEVKEKRLEEERLKQIEQEQAKKQSSIERLECMVKNQVKQTKQATYKKTAHHHSQQNKNHNTNHSQPTPKTSKKRKRFTRRNSTGNKQSKARQDASASQETQDTFPSPGCKSSDKENAYDLPLKKRRLSEPMGNKIYIVDDHVNDHQDSDGRSENEAHKAMDKQHPAQQHSNGDQEDDDDDEEEEGMIFPVRIDEENDIEMNTMTLEESDVDANYARALQNKSPSPVLRRSSRAASKRASRLLMKNINGTSNKRRTSRSHNQSKESQQSSGHRRKRRRRFNTN